jgi:hypothetical protein
MTVVVLNHHTGYAAAKIGGRWVRDARNFYI